MRKSTWFVLICTILMLCTAVLPGCAERIYTNSETGYCAIIEDDIDLLTDEEELALMKELIPITEVTNIAFWSTRDASSKSSAINNAEDKHIELFGSFVNGAVFMIDMNARYMYLDTEGWIQGQLPKSAAEIITNNVRSELQAAEYYEACATVFEQIYSKACGEEIPEPMRFFSGAVISIMISILVMILLTCFRRTSLNYDTLFGKSPLISFHAPVFQLTGEVEVSREYHSDSDSSCSSCSSGSSGGGGSSCGGGGGGGGGSSCGGGSSF